MKRTSVIQDPDVFRLVPTVLATFSLTVMRGQQFHIEITASRQQKNTKGEGISVLHLFLLERKHFAEDLRRPPIEFHHQDWVIRPCSGCKNVWEVRISPHSLWWRWALPAIKGMRCLQEGSQPHLPHASNPIPL